FLLLQNQRPFRHPHTIEVKDIKKRQPSEKQILLPPFALQAMARGNQREKSREANLKKQAALGNNMSGTEMQRAKEQAADIMRQKQAAAEAKKAEASAGKK
ncbi:hypothetical protein L249_0366, partial [Ophiocordyceps polyrhachis-furcata BCC 54312]